LKTGGGFARLWVRVPRLPLLPPRYANGRAARLKPGCLWVRLPPWVGDWSGGWGIGLGNGEEKNGSVGNLADHSRSEREMLRVRIPPEPLVKKGPHGAVWSARLVVNQEVRGSNPLGGADRKDRSHGTPTGRAAELKPPCPVGSTPTRATRWKRWVVLLTAACKTVAINL
jgi:hypothetical protein